MKCNLFVYTELEYTSIILMLLIKNDITYSRQKIVNLSQSISQKYHQITTNYLEFFNQSESRRFKTAQS